MDEKVTLEDIRALAAERLQAAFADPPNLLRRLSAFFAEAFALDDRMTPEARIFIEDRQERMLGFLGQMLTKVPDSPEHRRMKRAIAYLQGHHLNAQALIADVQVLHEVAPIVNDGHEVFVRTLQRVLDLLHDTTAQTHNGAADFARINLLYWAVDELSIADFLARKGYSSHTYPHLRSVMEILDKVELFTLKPELAEVWVTGTERDIWRKLSPPRVREKLGRSSFDPLYQYFSEQGAHSTWTAVQGRIKKAERLADSLSVGIGVGGVRNDERQTSLLLYCVVLTNLCLMRAATAFPAHLNETEVASTSVESVNELFGFADRVLETFPEADRADRSPLKTSMAALKKTYAALRKTAESGFPKQDRDESR